MSKLKSFRVNSAVKTPVTVGRCCRLYFSLAAGFVNCKLKDTRLDDDDNVESLST